MAPTGGVKNAPGYHDLLALRRLTSPSGTITYDASLKPVGPECLEWKAYACTFEVDLSDNFEEGYYVVPITFLPILGSGDLEGPNDEFGDDPRTTCSSTLANTRRQRPASRPNACMA